MNMTKLAVIDLDGVIANVEQRFLRADVEKSLYLAGTDRPDRLQREATDLYWRTVFRPDLVELDTVIEGATEAIDNLFDERAYAILLLTSRPEAMREATVAWLWERAYLLPMITDSLLMKPTAFQYVKTVVWKAGTIQQCGAMWGATEVLVVDDEQANRAAVAQAFTNSSVKLTLAASLQEALARLDGTWVEPEPVDPFLPEE